MLTSNKNKFRGNMLGDKTLVDKIYWYKYQGFFFFPKDAPLEEGLQSSEAQPLRGKKVLGTYPCHKQKKVLCMWGYFLAIDKRYWGRKKKYWGHFPAIGKKVLYM